MNRVALTRWRRVAVAESAAGAGEKRIPAEPDTRCDEDMVLDGHEFVHEKARMNGRTVNYIGW